MVTLEFKFNEQKVAEAGYTCDVLLQPMREYAEQNGITESRYGYFEKSGEDAMCDLTNIVAEISLQSPWYIDMLDSWILDVYGESEDCIDTTRRYFELLERERIA